ncbi:MAG: fibronectin type III domain-containing protein, partial [Bacteroidota bacterium]
LNNNGNFSILATLGANSTSYAHGSLNPGQVIKYRVKAENANLSSAYSNQFQTSTYPLPQAPTNLSASNVTQASLDLSWVGSGFGDQYLIQQSLSPTTGFSTVANVNFGTNAYAVSNLQANTTYYFRVLNQFQGANSDPSGVLEVTTLGNPSVQRVARLILVNANSNQDIMEITEGAVINLNDLASQNLNIRAETDPEVVGSVVFSSIGYSQTESAAPYAMYGDVSGNYYNWVPNVGDYTVNATPYTQAGGQGTAGEQLVRNFSFIRATIETPPTDPSNVNAVPLTTDKTLISWQDNANNEVSYRLEVDANLDGNYQLLASLNANTQSYEHENLNPGQSLRYRVQAIGNTLASNFVASSSVTTFATPPAPSNVQASQVTQNSATISWNAPAFGEQYLVQQSSQANGGFSTIATLNWGNNQQNITGLSPNTTYFFRVINRYKGLDSSPSSNVSFTTLDNTPAPQAVIRFDLYNADNDQLIGELQEGDTINYAEINTPRISITAITNPSTVGSVRFSYDNVANFNTETTKPYAINGDTGDDLNAWTPSLGNHTLTATPYDAGGGNGNAGTPLTVNFIVTDQGSNTDPGNAPPPVISGELKKWHKVTISFFGPNTSEDDTYNPFLNYRLDVTFSNGNKTYVVPGYYAADGDAGQSGSSSGNVWKVHFSPDAIGTWNFSAAFRKGQNIAVSDNPSAGESTSFHGQSGSFNIAPSDKKGGDFRAKGRLQYVDEHYLRFAETGEYFLKGGAGSPENFLAYQDFDGTYNHGGTNYIKTYNPHVGDWKSGDPTWKNGKGKGIIGALNYLASKGMNSVYFVTMNVNGDGKDVWPWTSHTERNRYDISKLDQWEIVFAHMNQLGILLHVFPQETENDQLLNGGNLGNERKLYYRELIARFSHHLGIDWNMGEENDLHVEKNDPNNNFQKSYATFFKQVDPYQHHTSVHTYPRDIDVIYPTLLGYKDIGGAALQVGNKAEVHERTKNWINQSKNSGHKWVVNLDEIGPAGTGVVPDATDFWHPTIRKEVLWGNLMAGGGGVEWYFGYYYANSDLTAQDWRSRDNMWNLTRYALEFFQTYLPFWNMESRDELTTANGDYVFAQPGEVYAVYLPNGGSTNLDFQNFTGNYTKLWYNPRSGESWQDNNISVTGFNSVISTGTPPSDADKDWVVLFRKDNFVTLTSSSVSLNQDMSQAAFPNPASYHLNFAVDLPQTADVKISLIGIEDVALEKVVENVPAGEQVITIETDQVSDGVYTYILEYTGQVVKGRIVIQH